MLKDEARQNIIEPGYNILEPGYNDICTGPVRELHSTAYIGLWKQGGNREDCSGIFIPIPRPDKYL